MNSNNVVASIETDRAISAILSNFSEDYILSTITESLQYKFRPFNTRMPDFPTILMEKFALIRQNAPSYIEVVNEKETEVYNTIIDLLCSTYHLSVVDIGIPEEGLFTVCFYLYKILVSEFTERMINFFSDYIIQNCDSLLTYISDEKKTPKTSYSRRIYTQQNYVLLYDNMEQILDIVAGLDIPFVQLMSYLSDDNTANLIGTFINDCGDIYKYFYASFILDPSTRTDMITSIKLAIVKKTTEVNQIIAGDE